MEDNNITETQPISEELSQIVDKLDDTQLSIVEALSLLEQAVDLGEKASLKASGILQGKE